MTLVLVLIFVGLCAAMCLGALFVDRVNFPQRKFKPKTLKPGQTAIQDRVGAHLADDDPRTSR